MVKSGLLRSLFCAGLVALPGSVLAADPKSALALLDRVCGSPTPQNADATQGLAGWSSERIDRQSALRAFAEWRVAQGLADKLLGADEIDEEMAFQLDILGERFDRAQFFWRQDSEGSWLLISDNMHPEFKDRRCTVIGIDDGSAAQSLYANLPFAPSASLEGLLRWQFDGGFGTGEDREIYKRSAFVFTGVDGQNYWGLEWSAQTRR